VKIINELVFPGLQNSLYAFDRTADHRNIYRIPIRLLQLRLGQTHDKDRKGGGFMRTSQSSNLTTRREMLRLTTAFTGGCLLSGFVPRNVLTSMASAEVASEAQQASAAPLDAVAQCRANYINVPVNTLKLSENMYLLYGPGGNILVLDGGDGRLLVDTFVSTGWSKLKDTLTSLGSVPLEVVIAAGNQGFQDKFSCLAANALPQLVFKDSFQLFLNNEEIVLGYFQPAHTDTDICVHFQKADVLHMGDTFFNGNYPFIDVGTGGNIDGMIGATERALRLITSDTKVRGRL
jgi:metallo-beta-lactamase superfamily protein